MFPPKKINWIYGYRTSSSTRNQDTWDTANNYSAKIMIIKGIVLIIIGLLSFLLPDMGRIGTLIGLGLVIASIIILAVKTEKHLDKLFDKEGNRRV